jgi:hypothetical protein
MTNPQPTVKRMTEPHKRSHRHPKYKTAYRVKNWHEYDQTLRNRGDITLWIKSRRHRRLEGSEDRQARCTPR